MKCEPGNPIVNCLFAKKPPPHAVKKEGKTGKGSGGRSSSMPPRAIVRQQSNSLILAADDDAHDDDHQPLMHDDEKNHETDQHDDDNRPLMQHDQPPQDHNAEKKTAKPQNHKAEKTEKAEKLDELKAKLTDVKWGNITEDKELYNAIKYRLGKVGLGGQWKSLHKTADDQGLAELLQELFRGKPGEIDPEYMKKMKRVERFEQETEEGGWIPWDKACAEEGGADLLKEIVEAGTVQARRNKKLPANSSIQWPRNLQIKFVEDRFKKGKKTTDETTQEQEATETDQQEMNADRVQVVGFRAAGEGVQPKNTQVEAEKREQEECRKAAQAHITKAHTAFDQFRRDARSVLDPAKEHRSTRGCVVIDDLEKLLEQVDSRGKALMACEALMKQGTIEAGMAGQCGAHATEMAAMVREGRKMLSGLRNLMSLSKR